jgi:type I protein arginine methyltransferase
MADGTACACVRAYALHMDHLDLEHLGFPADVIPLQYQALLLSDDRRMSAFADAITHAVRVVTKVLADSLSAGSCTMAGAAR